MNTTQIDGAESEQTRLFFVCVPGTEAILARECQQLGFQALQERHGGLELEAQRIDDIWTANLALRGCTRVLVRIAEFSAVHISQLDKKARRIDWQRWLPKGALVDVEATARRSKLYHSGAIEQRVRDAALASLGSDRNCAPVSPTAKTPTTTETTPPKTTSTPRTTPPKTTQTTKTAPRPKTTPPSSSSSLPPVSKVMVRIEKDWCTISLDSSGEPLYKRGGKLEVGKAPLRETLAAQFLVASGFEPGMSVVDPMCGSGTFLLEAASISAGHLAGGRRAFAFEHFAGFDRAAFEATRARLQALFAAKESRCFGADRDAGAIARAAQNADRMGIAAQCEFVQQSLSNLRPKPGTPPGLVICNPPYGRRLGDKSKLSALYATFGALIAEHFRGWRVALVTDDAQLAKSAQLPWRKPSAPISHGGINVRLWQGKP